MRATRAQTTRNTQSRAAQARKAPDTQEKDMLWFDQDRVPPGMVYGWVRRSVLNMEDKLNMQERAFQGWKPVPSDRHPELVPSGWGAVIGDGGSIIERGGLLLCECPKADLMARQRKANETTAARLRMPHIQFDKGTAAPTFDDSEVAFERVTTEKNAEFKE